MARHVALRLELLVVAENLGSRKLLRLLFRRFVGEASKVAVLAEANRSSASATATAATEAFTG